MNIESIKSIFSGDILSVLDKTKAEFFFTDEEKKFVHANKAFLNLFQINLESIKNKKCWELIHPESQSCELCKDNNNVHFEAKINGSKHNILISNSHIGNNLKIAVIHKVTKIVSEIDKLTTELDKLKKILKDTFGSYKFLISCSDCQRIRLEDGTWVNPADMDSLMEKTEISHGLCAECAKPYLDGLLKKKD